MDCITIISAASYSARDYAISFLKSGFVANEFRFQYDLNHLLCSGELTKENFPLIIKGYLKSIPLELRIYPLTAGYGGEGPHNLLEVLTAAGFPVDEEAIFTEKWARHGKISFSGDKSGMKIDF